MKFDRNLTAEETVEVGREFRSMRRMFLRIIIIAIIPLFVMGVAFCAFANIRIKRMRSRRNFGARPSDLTEITASSMTGIM